MRLVGPIRRLASQEGSSCLVARNLGGVEILFLVVIGPLDDSIG